MSELSVAWAIVCGPVARTVTRERWQQLRLFFLGCVSGWLSATIARAVYPPPKRWRSVE